MLCLAQRCRQAAVVGVELQPMLAALAQRNMAENDAGERVSVAIADLRHLPFGTPFDSVMANPPHHEPGRHRRSPDAVKAIADNEGTVDLTAWCRAAALALRPRGWLTMIHRADRLPAVLTALSAWFGGATVVPLWPRAGVAAKRVLIRGRLGSRAPATLHPGVVLHHADGSYAEPISSVLGGDADLTGLW